jgi:hypothetical protein
MASYNIKLVDHTGSTKQTGPGIQSEIKGFFDRVFAKTSDSVTVAWGTGSSSDDIVLHFVKDVGDSYIRKTIKKNATISANAGGHTTLHGHKICSEFYKDVVDAQGKARAMSNRDYARLAFHESLHNVFPAWTEADLMGHGGLSDTPVGKDLSQFDIDTMRKGIALKSVATQQL